MLNPSDEGIIEAGPDFIVKAQLRVPVRELPVEAARDIVNRAVVLYTQRLRLIAEDIKRILERAGARSVDKSLRLFIVPDRSSDTLQKSLDDLFKAGKTGPPAPKPPATNKNGQPHSKKGQGAKDPRDRKVHSPGSRGGHFWIDKHGNVRYGHQPETHPDYYRPAEPKEIANHFVHYRPTPLMGISDRNFMDALRTVKVKGQKVLTETDLVILEAWDEDGGIREQMLSTYVDEKGKPLFDEKALAGDMNDVYVTLDDGTVLPYEQMVRDAIMAQDWGTDPQELEKHVDGLFERYKQALEDPAVNKLAATLAGRIEDECNAYFVTATDQHDLYTNLGSIVVAEPDPQTMVGSMALALNALRLVIKPKKGEVGAGAGHLKGKILPNDAMVERTHYNKQGVRTGGYLTLHPERLVELSASQLMAVYVSGKLYSAHTGDGEYAVTDATDPDGPKHSLPYSALSEAAMQEIRDKLGLTDAQAGVVRARLDNLTHMTGVEFNKANVGKTSLVDHIMGLDTSALKSKESVEKAKQDFADFEARQEAALKAQSATDSLDVLPASMKDGAWGAHYSGKAPEPHQTNPKTQLPWRPFLHQLQSIAWMAAAKCGLLSLDAGMGKTPATIAFCEKMREEGKLKGPVKLFLPPSLMLQWPKEVLSFAPGLAEGTKILNLAGLSMEARKMVLKSDLAKNAHYILLSVGTLNAPGGSKEGAKLETGEVDPGLIDDGTGGTDNELADTLASLGGATFIDEAHQGGFKTDTSLRYNIAKRAMVNDTFRFGITATPVTNGPMDLFHLTNLFAPGHVGSKELWEGATHGAHYDNETMQWQVANKNAIKDLARRRKPWVFYKSISDPAVVADMGKQMPDLTSTTVDIMPSEIKDQSSGFSQLDYIRENGVCDFLAARALDKILKKRQQEGKEELSDRTINAMLKLMTFNLKRQAAISPELVDDRYKGHAPKLDKLADDIVNHLSGGEKDHPLIIFSSLPGKTFPLLRARLLARGIDESLIGQITGDVDPQKRSFEQDMANQGKRKVLLVGTMAGGAGLNLQKKPKRGIFLDEPWHHSAKRQALGRFWRTGSPNPMCFSDTMNMVGSIDARIAEKIAGKQTMSTALLSDENAFDKIEDAASGLEGKTSKELLSLSGKVAVSGMGEAQLAALTAAAEKFNFDPKSFGDDFADVSESDVDEDDGTGAAFDLDKKFEKTKPKAQQGKNPNEFPPNVDYKYSQEGAASTGVAVPKTSGSASHSVAQMKKELPKKAPHLVTQLDVKAEMSKWLSHQQASTAKVRHGIEMMQVDLYQQAGKKKEAEAAKARAERIKKDYEATAAAYPELKLPKWGTGAGGAKANTVKVAKPEAPKGKAEKETPPPVKVAPVKASGKGAVTEEAPSPKKAKPEPKKAKPEPKKPEKAKTKPEPKKPEKAKEKPALAHKMGVNFKSKKLPQPPSTKPFGSMKGVDWEDAHHLYKQLMTNKHKSIDDFATKVVLPFTGSKAKALKITNDFFNEMKKMKIME